MIVFRNFRQKTDFDSICFLSGLVLHFQYGSEWTFGDVTQHLEGFRTRNRGIKVLSQWEQKQNKSVTWVRKYNKSIFQVSQFCVGGEFHLKVLVPRHNFVGEFGQEHGDKCRKAPFRSQLVWADPCQPQHVLRDVWGLALEQSTLVQTQTGRGKTTEGRWDGQTHAGEESTPPGWVLILRPL